MDLAESDKRKRGRPPKVVKDKEEEPPTTPAEPVNKADDRKKVWCVACTNRFVSRSASVSVAANSPFNPSLIEL
eukprot:3372706-Pyramimonas_sp.AAC.1